MSTIIKDLKQYTTYIKSIDLTFNQYLIDSKEPLLVHTGNIQMATELLPQLEDQLKGRELKYIFVSHFESDECGGLSHILNKYSEAKIICSEVTARQLNGFGFNSQAIIKKPGETIKSDDYQLEFLSYPCEMHLWEGLLLWENMRKIFFSSDLMIRLGEIENEIIESDWKREIDAIKHLQVPDSKRRLQLQKNLERLEPSLVAPGHGPCLKV